MAGADEDSRIHDGVRDSKIYWDIQSKFDRKIELQYNLQPDFSHDGRVFPRSYEGDDSKGFGRVGRELHGSPSAGDGRRNIVREVNRRWIRSYIPIFNGTSNRKDLLVWVEIVDRFFEEVQPPENLKCKLAYYALEGEAELWWRNMQHQRLLKGASKIKIWPWMKYLLFTEFKPATCSTKCSFQVYNRRHSVNGVGKYPNESYNGTGNPAIQKTFATGVILPTKCSTKLLVESASIKQAQNESNIYDIEGKAYMKGGHDYSNKPHSTIADASAKGTQAIENMVAQIMDMKLETVKVDDHPHEEVKIESYNVEKECSIHEVVDGEMSSTKQCIKTIALACPHSESNKVEEKSTDELVEGDLAESRDHPNAMLGQLKKGIIEGHVMEAEHNLTVTIKVLNDVSETSSAYFALTDVSKLDRPLKYDSPTHVLPIDPPKLLEKTILKLLVKGLVEKCSSKAVRIESQLGRATKIGNANDEQYRSQIHLEPKDINILVGKTLMFNFDPGGARNNHSLRNCWKDFLVNKQVCVARYYAFFVSKLQFMNGETLSLKFSTGGKLQTEPKAHERPVQKLEFALGWIYVLKMARKVYVNGFDNNWKDGKNQFDRFLIWFRVLREAMDFISPTKLYLCSNGEWIWYLFIAGWLRLIRILVHEQHFQDFIDICFTIISSLMPHLMVIFGTLCIYCPIEVQVHVIPGLAADIKNPSLQKIQSYNEPLSRVLLLIILCLTKPEEVLLVVGLDAPVPWVLCSPIDVPEYIKCTCKVYYCVDLRPNSTKEPMIWTGNHDGWYTNWGWKLPHGPVEDFVLAAARCFQLNEYGLLSLPKWGHLEDLHLHNDEGNTSISKIRSMFLCEESKELAESCKVNYTVVALSNVEALVIMAPLLLFRCLTKVRVTNMNVLFDPGGSLHFPRTCGLNKCSLHTSSISLMINSTNVGLFKNALLVVIGQTKQGSATKSNVSDVVIVGVRSDELVKDELIFFLKEYNDSMCAVFDVIETEKHGGQKLASFFTTTWPQNLWSHLVGVQYSNLLSCVMRPRMGIPIHILKGCSVNITRGRFIPSEGWNDTMEWYEKATKRYLTNKFRAAVSSHLGIFCKSRHGKMALELFHKMVNGLDPPMDVDGASMWIAMSSLVDELLSWGDGDDVAHYLSS